MRLLILGGPNFLGRALIDAALTRNHEITHFNRGQTNPNLYPEIERLATATATPTARSRPFAKTPSKKICRGAL